MPCNQEGPEDSNDALDVDEAFCFEDAMRRSIIDECLAGYLDLGPTDALSPEAHEYEYDAFFGSSPLSSVPSSTRSSRSTSPTRNSATRTTASTSSEPSGNSKTRRNKKKKRSHRRNQRQKDCFNAALPRYIPRPAVIQKYVAGVHVEATNYDTSKIPSASTGYIALPDQGGRVHSLDELVGRLGFTLVKWTGLESKAITDREGRVIAVLLGRPDTADWEDVHRSAHEALQASAERCKFPKKAKSHRRGDFSALSAGISFGGGQQMPGNLTHSRKNTKQLQKLLSHKSFIRISGFASAGFATWAPRLYAYYDTHFNDLLAQHPSLRRNFRESVWASVAFNFGPRTVTRKHRDYANLPFGLCAVTALGHFDSTKGGHMVFWELKLVVEFPPGSTILLPSAIISHSNTPVGRAETRTSLTQYSAGGLFRWGEQGYQKKDDFLAGLSDSQKDALQAENDARCKLGLSLFSTVDEIQNM